MKIKTSTLITAYNDEFTGNVSEFTRYLNKHYNIDLSNAAVDRRIKYLKNKGRLPLDSGNKVPSNEQLKGTSTLYNSTGDVQLQWVKTDVAKETILSSYREAIEEINDTLTVSAEPQPIPTMKEDAADITTFYPLPDLHFGLLIHAEESNHECNWDMKIATEWVLGAMDHLVETAPPSKYAVITDLGDFLHAEDNTARTNSGHQLDTDGRHSKIVKTSFEIVTNLIDKALTKHEEVYFYSVAGNHSENSSIYLKAFLSAWYKNEPRVTISDPHVAQQYHLFGSNIIGFTHGHELKPSKASEVLVYDNQNAFSTSTHRYFHFGRLMAA